ncbi:helix-turn-helix transcriptional regulator [Catenuloplanes japonicus]|uniref:helix-turn-helix transcriptional regulator n=1 Tax=Catenuloplanes japonicus TaxID=33876 RepID=UPI000A423DF1|nr:helix-turn-helix transcriptional regulator [Catenuloplanes japonicus]
MNAHPELGSALRAWRDRLSPADAGLPGTGRRRSPGLRREEVAELSGLSVDYLVRLEQGRAGRPSRRVAEALARALQLTETERDHLLRVAGIAPAATNRVPRHVPPGVQRLVARLGEVPVAVFTAHWTLLTFNRPWQALLGTSPVDGNVLHTIFAGGDLVPWPITSDRDPAEMAAAFVADLRAVRGRYPHDPELADLIAGLRVTSPAFAEAWDGGAIAEYRSERKTIHHPAGPVTLDCDVLTVPGADLRVVAYTAAEGSPDAEALRFLTVTAFTSLHSR